MNAKITITVPMDKVHLKVSEMLDNVVHEIEELQVNISDIGVSIARENDIMHCISEIDRCRKNLSLLDANLEDCYSVLIGLVNFKTKKNEIQNKLENSDAK